MQVPTHTGGYIVVEIARVTGAGSTRQGSLAASRTGQTAARRSLTSCAGLGAG